MGGFIMCWNWFVRIWLIIDSFSMVKFVEFQLKLFTEQCFIQNYQFLLFIVEWANVVFFWFIGKCESSTKRAKQLQFAGRNSSENGMGRLQ